MNTKRPARSAVILCLTAGIKEIVEGSEFCHSDFLVNKRVVLKHLVAEILSCSTTKGVSS